MCNHGNRHVQVEGEGGIGKREIILCTLLYHFYYFTSFLLSSCVRGGEK